MRTRCASRSGGGGSWLRGLRIPFWTVDADVVVPSKLMEKAQYGAYTIRPRLYRLLPDYLHALREPAGADRAWKRPKGFIADSVHEDMTRGWKDLDRSVGPVEAWTGGTHAALKRLKHFTGKMLKDYEATAESSGGGWDFGAVALSALRAHRAGDDCAGGGGGGEEESDAEGGAG